MNYIKFWSVLILVSCSSCSTSLRSRSHSSGRFIILLANYLIDEKKIISSKDTLFVSVKDTMGNTKKYYFVNSQLKFTDKIIPCGLDYNQSGCLKLFFNKTERDRMDFVLFNG